VPSNGTTIVDFTMSNPSGQPAKNATLFGKLGNGLIRTKMECTAVLPATCPTEPTSTIIDSLPGGGSVRFRWTVAVDKGSSGARTAEAEVESADDQVTTNNAASVEFNTYAAEVSVVTSTNAGSVTTGSSISYSVTVSNAGPDTARDLQLRDTMSEGLLLKSIDCTASGGASCPTTLGATMDLALLPSGGSLNFTIVGQLSDDVIVPARNTMQVTVAGDGNEYNDKASVATTTLLPTSPGMPSFVVLQSEDNDWVGSGQDWAYNQTNATFDVHEVDGYLLVRVNGDVTWEGKFYMPAGFDKVSVGSYSDDLGAPFHDPATGGMSWGGDARGCNTHSDTFSVDNVTYAADVIVAADIRFEQHCEHGIPALRGQIHWTANDATHAPGPVNPPPPGLWAAGEGTLPTSGNFFYFESDPQDFVGRGRTRTFTQTNSVITVTGTAADVKISVAGDETYNVEFRVMVPLTQLAPGYYPNAQGAVFGNPSIGGLEFYGDGHGCNTVKGWFAIDNIAFSAGGAVIALDGRFLQHCDGYPPTSRGVVHWRSDDPTQPVGPQVPPPPGLWSAPANAIPATGNFVYVESDPGDWVGQGLSRVYTPLNSVIWIGKSSFVAAGNHFEIRVDGDDHWIGDFQAMNTLPKLVPGYYGDLLRFPFHNPTAGGMDWGGNSNGCNVLDGWFVIDSVAYAGNALQSITLRFEQHCEHAVASVRGMIRWSADDLRQPLPPAAIPPGLWQPPDGATPASGNYMYLKGDPDSEVLAGRSLLLTALNAQFTMGMAGPELTATVEGDSRWSARFKPMVSLEHLEPGFYDLPFGGSLGKGDFAFSCHGRDIGWFVVDSVTYTNGSLTAIDLRLMEQCLWYSEVHGPVYVKIHWRADDTLAAPGPQNPPPAGLWEVPGNSVPASGNFFYITGDPGEFITLGETFNYTPATATFEAGWNTNGIATFDITPSNSTSGFRLYLRKMNSIARLEPGYYPNLQGALGGNPTVAGLNLSSPGRGCASADGWFVVHDVTYSGDNMTSIDATFEAHCGGTQGAAARGRVRWSQ
jgi:uncharacterized repeat protein (TIGR01451 family)